MRTNDINVEVGDTVAIVANVTSTKKEFSNQEKPVFFTNLQIDDMVIVEKGTKPQEAKEVTTEEVATEAPKEVSESAKEEKVDKNVPAQEPKAKEEDATPKEEQPEKKNQDFTLEEEAEDSLSTSDSSSNEGADSSDPIFKEFLQK